MLQPERKKYTLEEFNAIDPFLPERREFIDGNIYIGESEEPYDPAVYSPVDLAAAPSPLHQEIISRVLTDIQNHILKNKGKCKVFTSPMDVKLDGRIVQPDVFVTCKPENITLRGLECAPDWVIEILSPSSSKRDAVDKLYLYRCSGVREYWIIDPTSRRVLVYFFEEGSNVEMYTFESSVTVHIYKDSPEPLTIRLADYFE